MIKEQQEKQTIIQDIPFPDEIEHLALINSKLDAALQSAEASVKKLDMEYMSAKRYMVENRGEIDPHEMFQTELLLKQTDRTGAFAVEIRNKIAKLKDSPYFARIDFMEKSKNISETYYIGRSAFNHENELLIFDWRAPVSGMFYDYEIGSAAYEAPSGRIEGRLIRKRQFKIRDGVMEYALESSANVLDDILQKELSHTSDEKMKSIISTIQKEQNQIIRNEKAETLIIQGVAGSGKTSIALHRIAFLLYRHKNRLSSKNVTIISPNKVFGDYISNVIPELGEEPIYELSFSELADIQLEGIVKCEPDRDPLEIQDEDWAERVRFKSTLEFLASLEQYVKGFDQWIFEPEDYIFGRFTADREWIRRRFLAYSGYPVKKRLVMAAEDICERFKSDNLMDEETPRVRTIEKKLTSMLVIKNSLSLYKNFYKHMGVLKLFRMPEKKTLEWADIYPFLYIHAAFAGLKESGITKHLVIDEMQDYTPVQYAVLNLMFPCSKTILGDFGQFINPNHLHKLDDIRKLYPESEFVMLNKSYRSTYEIMVFAKSVLNVDILEPVKRHGEKPEVVRFKNEQEQLQYMKSAVRDFTSGKNVSMGIILKTNSAARAMYDSLSPDCRVNLITPESLSFENGVSITSIQMSKGLEFDEVIVPDADCRTYFSDYDRSLLYIACTRAMHRLTLLHTGSPTVLIRGEKGKEST